MCREPRERVEDILVGSFALTLGRDLPGKLAGNLAGKQAALD